MTAASEFAAIDTHAHLDDAAFDGDRDRVIESARRAGIECIVNVGYRPERWETTLRLGADHPEIVAALGIHPHHADEATTANLQRLRSLLERGEGIAIGEIGLDRFRDGVALVAQDRAFRRQLDLACDLGLPIIVHQRSAEGALIEVMEAFPRLPTLILHSFEGSPRLIDYALERALLIGVGGLATKARSEELRQSLRRVPVDRILLETDSPYLTPAGIKSRRNEPANLLAIARRLAPLWELEPGDFLRRAATTAVMTFRLDRRTLPPSAVP